MEKTEKIYDDSELETYFDSTKDGYWLIIKNEKPHFFFEREVLQDFIGLDIETFIRRMGNYNPLVLFAAKSYKIPEPERSIKHALEETKKIEDRKLEEALKSTKQ